RVDARVKVTGEAKYAADYEMPGMLWCKILRSPHPHARIMNLDTSRAERLPGVKAICVGKDFGGYTWGFMPQTRDEPPLAVDKVLYLAEGVAAVAAIDEDIAEEAVGLIKVEYEELPGVFDPEEAMKNGAPQVHDYVKNNLSCEFHMDCGDVEKGFSESDLVREDRFETGRVTHGYLEPPAGIAYYDSSGITIWAAKQSPYFLYRHLAACFKLPLSKVRVIQPFIGGGFGGTKNDSLAGDYCAVLLSKKTGRPVKFVYNMEEELMVCRRRHNMIIHNKMGMKKDGIIMAMHSRVIADGGAYTAIGPLTMYLTGVQSTVPYKLPNFKHDAYRIFTNNPVGAAMRGHGVTHTRFAAEIQMDIMAEELGINPVSMRLKNAVSVPHETINKIPVHSCGFTKGLKTIAGTPNWSKKNRKGKQGGYLSHGVGISGAAFLGGARQLGHQSCGAVVRLCEDGTVNYLTGATDCGQGSDTILVQIIAEELGLRVDDIDIKRVDTAFTPCDAGSYGSRVTPLAGEAAQYAAIEIREQLAKFAAKKWEANPQDIVFKDQRVFVKESPDKVMSFRKLAQIACYSGTGAVIVGRGYSHLGLEPYDFETGIGIPGTSFSFTSHLAEVDVDLETGFVKCTDMVIAHDCGRPINPINVEAQNQGGAMQGMGQALYEQFEMDHGKTLNPTLTDYKMPLSLDVPKIDVIDIITEDTSPYGAKEASEGSIVSSPSAVVSAIHDATGIWFKEQPVTPEKIVMALREKQKEKG
ncbi:MAG: xanthine dehydrogenase family protein molybdopterin-binding subunit, partial [Thermodesulfobacteriota bacterium]|nr:xanthine dehydrogenase family protein molybdopterin-binding subunit [Thermodesulfobacteriota bacterium]